MGQPPNLAVYYADYIELPLPEGHRFPHDKYRLLRERLLEESILQPANLFKSPLATDEQLLTTHAPGYINSFLNNRLSSREQKRIGFPWSEALVNRVRASTGGPLAAARSALKLGYSAQLAGGTHHSHFDFGSGYCVFNDFAVTINILQQEEKALERVLVLDLDVHQGDGNATLLANNEGAFVASMHCEKNFPLHKMKSDMDVALDLEVEDMEYLEKLDDLLSQVHRFEPDLILYQAGVDGLKLDRLGRLNLSHEGLYERDLMVFGFAQSNQIPIAHVLGGGYSNPISHSVEAYRNTFLAAKKTFPHHFK